MKRLLFVVSEDWYFVSHRLHLARFAQAAGYRVAVLCAVSKHRQVIENAGIEVFSWELERRSRNPLWELRAVDDIRSAIRAFQPDVLHAVALKPVLYSALAIATSRAAPGVVHALGGLGFVFSSEKPLAKVLRPLVRFALGWAFRNAGTRLILQNPDDAQVLVGGGAITNDKIRLVRGAGVDTTEFAAHPERDGDCLVVLPARVLWDKGVGEFVEAARALKLRGLKARFALVGDRDDQNPACIPSATLSGWEGEGVVECWGRRSDMPAVLAQAHIVCLPSYREGLPKALLEAASCARAIVTFDVPGCREVVEHERNGMLVPFGDVDALAKAIERLVLNAPLRQRMGAHGRRMVERAFSQELIAAQTMRVWQEVAA